MTTGKTIALTRQTFVGKAMSLLLYMLSRLVISFLPRSKRLLISWLQSPCAVILEPRKTNSATVSTISPSIYHELMGPDAMILVFWMLSFRPTFSLSSFMFGPLRRPSAKKRKSMLLNWGAGENYKEIKPVNPKGNRSWTEYSLERLMLKLKLQHFAHLMQRGDSLEKILMLGNRKQKEKRVAEDEMVRQHHQFNGHEFEQTPGDSERQESLACCSPWGYKELNMT